VAPAVAQNSKNVCEAKSKIFIHDPPQISNHLNLRNGAIALHDMCSQIDFQINIIKERIKNIPIIVRNNK